MKKLTTTRRNLLKGLGGLGASALLPACGGDSDSSSGGSVRVGVGASEFDYPTVAPLPFGHGVASGDPLADRVIIWTRITETTPRSGSLPVEWSVATDPAMTQVVRSGVQETVAARDWTVKVDVTGLAPATTYYYRFRTLGADSMTGRTRTAPAAAVDSIRFAVIACSSYWSSHWSGYGHIARRNDLDLVIHCGDYIYDFVDKDEEVRARKDRFDTADVDYRDWLNLNEVRRRYALFRSDPNLCRAHQQHPWFIVWDNHDISTGYGNELESTVTGEGDTTTLDDVCRAFYEWTPTRPVRADGSGEFVLVNDGSYPQPPDHTLIYRRLPYGPLADFYGVDTQINLRDDRMVDASHLPEGEPSLFGRPQFDWLVDGLRQSQAAGTRWRVINNQTWFAPADVPDLAAGIPLPKLGISRWTDYTAERTALCAALRGGNGTERVRGTVFVSGDAHGNFASDLIEDTALLSAYPLVPALSNPRSGSTMQNQAAGFQRAATGNLPVLNTRAASVGVEFAGSSMGRGGADELVSRALIDAAEAAGLPAFDNPAANVAAARAVELAVMNGNKNVQFIEWVDHGYGLVHLTAEHAIFECWWQDKLTPESPDILGMQLISYASDAPMALPAPRYRDQIDAVTLHGRMVAATTGTRTAEPAPETPLQAA